MFSTVYFNKQIEQAKKLDGIQDALSIPGVALIIFTIFFISYAHNVFMKRRRSEFGLFMTLGMSGRDITRLLLLENGAIAVASILSGLLAGSIFSRLFFMLLMSRVELQVEFHLSGKMFLYSIGAFLLVFLIAVGKSLFLTLRSSVIQTMKSNRVSETIKMRSPWIGFLGFMIMGGSLLTLYFTFEESSGAYLPLWTMGVLIGLYIFLRQFISFLIEVTKKIPVFYFRRMLFLTSLDYKFKQLTSIIMLVSVMAMITIFYSTLLLTFYKSSETNAINNNPYDVAFYQTDTKNNLNEDELYNILDQPQHRIEEHLVIPTITHYEMLPYVDGVQPYRFMSLNDYNKLTGDQAKLLDHEYLFYLNTEAEYAHVDPIPSLRLTIEHEKVTYKYKGEMIKRTINLLPDTHEFIIINERQFEHLEANGNGYISNLQLLNVSDWKATGDALENLQEKFVHYNESTVTTEKQYNEYISEAELFRVASKIDDYHNNRSTTGIMFFVTTFLSVMFFFGTFILLYLNLFSEIEEERAKYHKLSKIGMTTKEIKGRISSELRTIFSIPLLIGTILAFLYLVILSRDVGGLMNNLEILNHFLFIAGIYLSFQLIYYFYLRNKTFNHITR